MVSRLGRRRLLQDQRIAAGDGSHLGKRQGISPDIFDLAHIQLPAHDLINEPGLAPQRLPHERVERSLGHHLGNVHFRVLVTLPDDPFMALGNIGRPP